jgi:type III pantothenate kinase
MTTAPQLLIDAGNSTLKAAVFTSGSLGPAAVFEYPQLDAFGRWLDGLAPAPTHAWLASVVHEQVIQNLVQQLAQRRLACTHWQKTPLPAGFQNLYEAPTLGADRLLAAIGARAAFTQRVLVVANFGTATTVDLVVNHSFHGGLIAPGVQMMLQSLHRDTAHLPLAQGKCVDIPRNTHDALFTGMCAATRGAVEHILHNAQRFGVPQLVASGGALAQIAAYLPEHRTLPHAVLHGLAAVAHHAAGGTTP